MNKKYLTFMIVSFFETIILFSDYYSFLFAFFVLILNMVFYFFIINKKYQQRIILLQGKAFIDNYLFSFNNNYQQKEYFQFASQFLNEKLLLKFNENDSEEEKIRILKSEINVKPFLLFSEIIDLEMKKVFKAQALKGCSEYYSGLLNENSFITNEKNILIMAFNCLEVNALVIILKIILNFTIQPLFIVFFWFIFLLESLVIDAEYYKLFNLNYHPINDFIMECLIRFNYQTPYLSFENSIFTLDKTKQKDFIEVKNDLPILEFDSIKRIIQKYDERYLKEFLYFVFFLAKKNNFTLIDLERDNELMINNYKNRGEMIQKSSAIEILFCVVIIFLIYYFLNNYGL